MMGVNISGGVGCAVRGSDVSSNGCGGAMLHGGNRTTLVPSNHSVSNCSLGHNQRWIMNYAPTVLLGGVGNAVIGSQLHDSPNQCIYVQGNDHIIDGNEVHHCALQCADCGAVYSGTQPLLTTILDGLTENSACSEISVVIIN